MTAALHLHPAMIDRALSEPAPGIDAICVDPDPDMTALLTEPTPVYGPADAMIDERTEG